MAIRLETKLDAAEITAFLRREFPQMYQDGELYHIVEAGAGRVVMRMDYAERFLRPGGTISGPAMFALTDLAMYAAVLCAAGAIPLAVTTGATINFLRRPAAKPMLAEASLLKLGRQLAVGEVRLFLEGEDYLVAHATATYSLPPASAVK